MTVQVPVNVRGGISYSVGSGWERKYSNKRLGEEEVRIRALER